MALCHDIGHGPFSHSLEYDVLPVFGYPNFHHEEMSC